MRSDRWDIQPVGGRNRVEAPLLFAEDDTTRAVRGLEEDLLEQHGLPMAWFDVLNRLREAPQQRLRMKSLEAASLFTRSGLTRLVDRIEDAGFVRRERSPEDRRGVYVAISDTGNDKIDAVWADHADSIERHVGAALTLADAATIEAIAKRVLANDPVPTAVPGSS